MWRQTHLARRTACLSKPKSTSKLNTFQNSSSSSSQVLLESRNQIICLHDRELSSYSLKWDFRKTASFQLSRPFSSDSVLESSNDSELTEPVQEHGIVSNFNDDENLDVVSSESVENEGLESLISENEGLESLISENEGILEGKGVGFDASEKEVEEEVGNDAEKMENLLSLLQSSGGNVDGRLENKLNEMKLVLNEEFVVSVMEMPLVLVENLIGFYSWCLGKQGFCATKKTLDVLVRVVGGDSNKKNAYKLWDLFKEVGKEDGKLSTEILNELISLFARISKGKAAYEVFQKLEEFGCVPDVDTFYYTTEALCKRSMFDYAASVCQKMVNVEMLPDAEKIGNLIYYLCKGKKSRDAHSVYMLAKEKNKCPPMSSVNLLINSLCFLPKKEKTATRDEADKVYSENIYLALKILDSFSEEERKSAAVQPFSSVSQALCKIGDINKAKELLFSMIKDGPPPGNAIFNATINGLSKAGELDEATKLLKVMEDRGLKPDVYTYTVIMSGYAKGGAMVEASQVLEEAKKKHSKLTPVTYHTMIRGYCKLEQFDEAVKLLAEMNDYGVQTNADEYNKLIQSLCIKVLDWGMAEKLLEEMKEKGLHLNGLTRGLVRAVKELVEEGKETEEAEVVM